MGAGTATNPQTPLIFVYHNHEKYLTIFGAYSSLNIFTYLISLDSQSPESIMLTLQ